MDCFFCKSRTKHKYLSINKNNVTIFTEDCKSVAMIMYAMCLIKQSINFLSPGRIPVVALDQPLFAIAKMNLGKMILL